MKRWFLVGIALSIVCITVLVCGCDDESESGNSESFKEAEAFPFLVDFEDQAIGSLREPWSFSESSGSSKVQVVESPDGLGNSMLINGGFSEYDYIIADYSFCGGVAADIRFDVEVFRDAGASFGWWLLRYPLEEGKNEIELGAYPNDEIRTRAYGTEETMLCGAAPSNEWFAITVLARYEDAKYDVLINGQPTDCSDLDMRFGDQKPIGGFSLFDPTNEEFGGNVYFDNLEGDIVE